MDYFELENKQESDFKFIYDGSDTSEYFISKPDEEIKDLSDVSLQHLDLKESQSSQSSREVQGLEYNFDDTDRLSPKTNTELSKDVAHTGPLPVCRLCGQGINDEEITYLHEIVHKDETMIVDKINACLPITVSLEDSLPKQICSECMINLETSYLFSLCVTTAEEKLRHLQFCSDAESMNCPLCCEGCMTAVPSETNVDDSSDEYHHTETIYIKTEPSSSNVQLEKTHVNSSVSSNVLPSRKRGRSQQGEMDEDWSSTEHEPMRKRRATTFSRGRRGGSRIRSSKLKNMDCFICHSNFNSFDEALSHALSAHCDSMNETFPCPLCQSITTSEQELRNHVDSHNDKRELLVIRCVCGAEFSNVSSFNKHVSTNHPTFVGFRCPLCNLTVNNNAEDLTRHVFQEHQDTTEPNVFTCPVCTMVFQSEGDGEKHCFETHITELQMCPVCNSELGSDEEYFSHFMESHCSTDTFTVPSFYNCCVCGNNFRSQYHRIKHTCNVASDELYCRDCDKGFPTRARYVFHLQIHQSADTSMRCEECLRTFTDENMFYDHVRFQHESEEQVQCKVCQKLFKNINSLNTHMKRHETTRNHKCEECGKRFQNAQTLREHMVSHMSVKPFQCHICGAYLSRLSRLRVHLRTHSVKASKASMKAYKCSICTQLFPNMKDAIKHTEGHAEEQDINLEEMEVNLVFRCEFCDAFFHKTAELNAHRQKFHSDPLVMNPYTCSVCGATFSTYARVTTHKLSHGINTESLIVPDKVNEGEEKFVIPQYFLCHECDKRCLHYTYMSLHRRFQHASGKPIFTCDMCGDKFATSWSLQFHRKKQHSMNDKDVNGEGVNVNSLFHCQICEKPYVTETSLEHHMRKCHESGDGNDGNSYICETCGKTFQFKSALEAHTDAHQGMKRFKCNSCDKRFTHRAGLIRHMKLHSETDTFECEYCGKKFRDRTERENHRRAHTGERPYMCEVCGRTFHTRAVWLDHSRIHQDVRPYQCDICSQSFRRSYALKSHYLIHTGERPFSCDLCGKSFRLKQTLFAHRKKEHQNNDNDDPGQIILPDDVLLIEEDPQYDELPEVNLMDKNYMDSELVDNPDVPTTSLDKNDEWHIDPRYMLNRAVTETSFKVDKSSQPFQKYSLLLKSQQNNGSLN
ncbi:zinc finger protein 721-like [Macrosteles quadrilineatus]|uniref:zinc finger protein 721-like n=1 Tax=Macrosteles quadrilineatus TaxID=74068 RepID=UPI0023E2EDC1|nr:zinc finger protein 721-like [Macrosteles quadrilineatus]